MGFFFFIISHGDSSGRPWTSHGLSRPPGRGCPGKCAPVLVFSNFRGGLRKSPYPKLGRAGGRRWTPRGWRNSWRPVSNLPVKRRPRVSSNCSVRAQVLRRVL